MATLNNLSVPIAAKQNPRTKLDLSCDHVTTMEFMKLQPVNYRHLVAGQSINIASLATVTPSPMAVPTYGRMRLNQRVFFCPYRLVFPNFYEWKYDSIGNNFDTSALVQYPPVISSGVILDFFGENFCSVQGTVTNYDFYYNGVYHRFTPLGKRYFKILRSLGYVLMPGKDEFEFNALALLAFAKIVIDWYSNSNYLNDAIILHVERLFKYNDPSDYLQIQKLDLQYILTIISSVCYDSNGYFEGCFDNPVTPAAGQYSSLTMRDVTNPSNYNMVAMYANGSPYMKQSDPTSPDIGSQYLHDILRKVTEYQRRHSLSSARVIDRFLTSNGVTNSALRNTRSIYLGGDSLDINVGPVYATSNGSAYIGGEDINSVVGDYAGRGFGQKQKSFDYQADEDGILIVCATILPSGGYFQGYDRHNVLLDKTDFYTPEFDGTVDVVEKGEVFVSLNDTYVNHVGDYRGVFGYIGRYGCYKRPIDFVTGDVSLTKSIMKGGDSWHLMREFNESSFQNEDGTSIGISQQSHSNRFTMGVDSEQYNRVFNYMEDDRDPFIVSFHFDIGSFAPMKPLQDMFDWEDDDHKIELTNGAKVN